MQPIAIDTDAFLQAQVVQVQQLPDGGAQIPNVAMWWRREHPLLGATWHMCTFVEDSSCPAVMDDFGTLVPAEVRL